MLTKASAFRSFQADSSRILLIFSAGLLLGCQSRQANDQNPTPVESRPVTEAISEGGQSSIGTSMSELPSFAGTGGLAIDLLTDLFYVEHDRLPQTVQELEPYLPFEDSLEGFELVTGSQPDGGDVLLAVRQVDESNPHSSIYVGKELTPPGLTGYSPAIGVHDGFERYIILDDVQDSELLATRSQAYYRKLCSYLTGSAENQAAAGALALRSVPAAPSLESAKVGVMSEVLNTAAYYSAMYSTSRRSPASLSAMAEEFGGFNAQGWLNPYTGFPMAEVSGSSPTPGDYSEFSNSDGLFIGLHYLDRDGLVSTKLVGFQGQHQRAYLTPGMGTPQALTPIED